MTVSGLGLLTAGLGGMGGAQTLAVMAGRCLWSNATQNPRRFYCARYVDEIYMILTKHWDDAAWTKANRRADWEQRC
jgi:urocanate hydratase